MVLNSSRICSVQRFQMDCSQLATPQNDMASLLLHGLGGLHERFAKLTSPTGSSAWPFFFCGKEHVEKRQKPAPDGNPGAKHKETMCRIPRHADRVPVGSQLKH